MRPPMFITIAALCLTTATGALAQDPAAASLVDNGDFEGGIGGGTGWPGAAAGITWEEEEGNHFLRLTSPEPGKQVQAHRVIKLTSTPPALKLTFRARHEDISKGKESWHDGRLVVQFLDGEGKKVSPQPKMKSFRGSSEGWEEHSYEFVVPELAESLEIMPALFQVETGTLDIDDIVLVPVDAPTETP